MRENPLFTNGTLTQTDAKVAHIFEIELAKLKIMENATAGATLLTVDNIDHCFEDMYIYYSYNNAGVYTVASTKVITVTPASSTIELETGLSGALDKGSYIVESIYEDASGIYHNVSNDHIALYNGAFGGLNGKILITDYDLPILAPIKRYVYNNQDCLTATEGYGLYIPYPSTFNGTNLDNSGKKNQVTIGLANVDQTIGRIVLTHKALDNRKVIVKTVYLDSTVVYNMNKVHDNCYVGLGDDGLNDPFRDYLPIDESMMVVEFSGFIDSCSLNNEAATLTCYSGIDNKKSTMIPRRTYTTHRCPFIYKCDQCMFISDLTLLEDISDTYTGNVLVGSPTLKYYFGLLLDNETHVIKIGDEYIEIDGTSEYDGTSRYIPYPEKVRQYSDGFITTESSDEANYRYYIHIKTRGYNNTIASAHTDGGAIDLPICRKTFHDCKLHFNDLNYGAFIGIPKDKGYY